MTRSRNQVRYALLVGLLLRLLLPWYGHGFRYMDEHWQVMEPANQLVHGFSSVATEWREGLRSWIYPGLVSLPMRAAEAIGVAEPLWITAFVRMVHGLLAAMAIPVCYLAVQKLLPPGPGRTSRQAPWALGCAWFVALWPFAIYCGFHTQGDMIGALFILLGVVSPLLIAKEGLSYATAGAWFGVALAIKIDLAIAGLAYGIWQLIQGRLRRAFWLAAGVLPFVILVGLVDRLTWGSWFHSVLGHARANLLEHVGDQWGVSPWYTHVLYFYDITTVPALLGTLALPLLWRRLPENLRAIWFMNAFFVAAFCTIPHKEKRFIAPVLYSGLLAGFATLAWAQGLVGSRKARRALAGIALTVLAIHFGINTIVYLVRRPWWDRLQAIHQAGKIPGIQMMISPQWPAVFYFPRNIPSLATEADARSIGAATSGLKEIGVATDWKELTPLNQLGFRCEPWPQAKPTSADPVPQAYHCSR